MNGEVRLLVDNAGFVGVYGKRHSKCPFAYKIAKPVYDLDVGLACVVRVVKTRRMSGTGEAVADALSKGDWDRAWELIPYKNTDPEKIPRALLRWIQDPEPDLYLGEKILRELSASMDVFLAGEDI